LPQRSHLPSVVSPFQFSNPSGEVAVSWHVLQGKEAVVRVLPKTWEAIEERMLLVPDN
jgi:hypothetical protein